MGHVLLYPLVLGRCTCVCACVLISVESTVAVGVSWIDDAV